MVGIGSLVLLLALRRWMPFLIPGSLIVVLLGIAAVNLLGLDDDGLDIVGTIQSGLPDLGIRDVLAVAEPDDEPPMYVTIEEAIAATSEPRDGA